MDPTGEMIERLRLAGCIAAEAEAVEMLADDPAPELLEARLIRREGGEPLAWITGWTTFCGLRIRLVPGVYVPRPQTEDLARRAAAVLPKTGNALDLCCGSGAIGAHLQNAHPHARVIAIDVDPLAATCTRSNGVPALVGDVADPIRPVPRFDVMTAVAPYVPTGEIAFLPSDVRDFEPRTALDGGDRGITIIERIVDAATTLLQSSGHLLLEIGGDQDDVLRPLFQERFATIEWWHDEDGDLRGVHASHPRRPA